MFTNSDLIFAYTRAQALEDGVLIDVTETAKEAGVRFPVAVTEGVCADLNSIPEWATGESAEGRLWDVLTLFVQTAQRVKGDCLRFWLSLSLPGDAPPAEDAGEEPRPLYKLWARCHPGDNMEPVVTIMREGED